MKLPQLFKYAYEAIKNALICICFQNRNVNAGRSLVSFCWVYTYHFGDLFFFFYHSINQKIATTFRDQMLYKSGYELFMDNPYLWTILTMGIKLEGLMWALLKKRFLTQECEKIKTCIVKKKWQTIAVKLPQSYFMIWYVLCITSFWSVLYLFALLCINKSLNQKHLNVYFAQFLSTRLRDKKRKKTSYGSKITPNLKIDQCLKKKINAFKEIF